MFGYEKLDQLVFDDTIDADEFVIITGYIGPPIISRLNSLHFNTTIYVGMYGNKVSSVLHNSLLKYDKLPNISISYTKTLVHSKCYLWFKNNKLIKALIGSANFSSSGLLTPKKEVLGDILDDDFNKAKKYYTIVKANSFPIDAYVAPAKTVTTVDTEEAVITDDTATLSFLSSCQGTTKNIVGVKTKRGDVPASASLNWGFSNGAPSPNDAYIKIPAKCLRENPAIFPQKSSKENLPIDVIWDDGTEMQMLLEGNITIDGCIYPKQISTYKNKSEIGVYLRTRIGNKIEKELVIPEDISKTKFRTVANDYKDKLITKEMLQAYGRTNITIKVIGDKTYYFDFSVNEE